MLDPDCLDCAAELRGDCGRHDPDTRWMAAFAQRERRRARIVNGLLGGLAVVVAVCTVTARVAILCWVIDTLSK